jgi:ADP-heptose:LPS heptosyltransferase
LRRSHGIEVYHWPEAIGDYDQTAALVCALDRVVSVCTAVVHLGGALGRPVLVLAPVGAEWRYGQSAPSMPWYPSVRILRQPSYGAWDPVIAEAAAVLQAQPARPSAGTPPAP